MIDLETSDQLIRSDIACMIAILADALACDEDLNASRGELRNVVERLAYLETKMVSGTPSLSQTWFVRSFGMCRVLPLSLRRAIQEYLLVEPLMKKWT